MATDYEKLYRKTPHALGAPTKAFVDFFQCYPRTCASVLDVGCGQGRDALFIARLGHRVTGVDLSPSGVSDLLRDAASEGLVVEGDVADIRQYRPTGDFDVIVIDRTLHMLKEEDRLAVLARLAGSVSAGGFLLIADEKSNVGGFRDVLGRTGMDWTPVVEKGGYLFVSRGRD